MAAKSERRQNIFVPHSRPLGRAIAVWLVGGGWERKGVDTIRHWRMVWGVEFIETPTFTRLIGKLMDDDEYAKLQLALARRPDWGNVIPGGGGLRKLRWVGSGRGKRGGLRVIYYWQTADDQIWLLVAFPKSERDDLSHDEIKQLRKLVEECE